MDGWTRDDVEEDASWLFRWFVYGWFWSNAKGYRSFVIYFHRVWNDVKVSLSLFPKSINLHRRSRRSFEGSLILVFRSKSELTLVRKKGDDITTPFKLNVCSSWLINSKIVHLFGRAISRGMASFRSELIASGRFSRPRSAWLDTKDYDLRQQTLRWPGRGGNRGFEERKEFQFRYLWVSWNFVSKGFYPYR